MHLYHHQLMVNAKILTPPGPSEGPRLEAWVKRLIKNMNMELLNGPHSSFVRDEGNKGWTVSALIKTSHVVCHFWDEPSPALMNADFYSCSVLDPKVVFEMIREFGLVEATYQFLDRETGFKLLEGGHLFGKEA